MAPRQPRPTIAGSTLGTSATPTSLPPSTLAPNPRNPRDSYDDVDELAESIRQIGILQPLGVVRYEIFLAHYPKYESDVGTCEWVVINGNRRLAAARLVGLAEVPVTMLEHLGRDAMLDEAVLVENIHRRDLPPLREAQAIQVLVERQGSQAKAAARLGKTQGFISQRLALLKLAPALREALTAGSLPLEEARTLGRLTVQEQEQAWEDRQAESPGAPVALSAASEASSGTATSPTDYGVIDQHRSWPKRMKFGAPSQMATTLRTHLSVEERAELARLLLE